MDLKDYLDSASDASRRTRVIIITLVVASVLTTVAYLNALESSWMVKRISALNANDMEYAKIKLSLDEKHKHGNDEDIADMKDERYKQLYASMMRSYIETAFFIRVPFFGATIDINDLGLFSGLAFAVLLAMLALNLRSEIGSIRVAILAASKAQELQEFYRIYSTRHIFSLPRLEHFEDNERAWKLFRLIPMTILALPPFLYLLVAINDFVTVGLSAILGVPRYIVLVFYTIVFFTIIGILTVYCIKRWLILNRVWDDWWSKITPPIPPSGG